MWKMIVIVLIILVLAAGLLTYELRLAKNIVLENRNVSLEISKDDFSLERISYGPAGEIRFGKHPMWRIVMLDLSTGATVDAFLELDSLDRAWSREYEFGENESGVGLGLVWFREGLCSVHVSIFLPRNSSLSYWRITIENRDAGKSIWYVDFPMVSVEPIGGDPEDDLLALPVHGGALIGDPYHGIQWDVKPWEEVATDLWRRPWIDTMGSYPGNYNAQFAALYNDTIGLYLASYDGSMFSKRFLFYGNGSSLRMWVRNYPSAMLTPGLDYEVPYAFALGPFTGDWMDAADIYRDWAIRQVWCEKGPMYEWDDLSEAAYNIDVTTTAPYSRPDRLIDPEMVKDNLLAMEEFFRERVGGNVTVAVHWVGWSKYMDVMNHNRGAPNYLPPQDGFPELLEELKRDGPFRNDVYFTSHGADTNTPYSDDDLYRWSDLKKYACYNPLGEVYRRFTPHTAWMDPSQEGWRRIMLNESLRTLETCKVDGIYYDWYPKFRLEFSHHQGGGNFFAVGYRQEAREIREALRGLNPDFYSCPEGKSEIVIGVYDAMLMEWFHGDESGIVRPFAGIGRPIPLVSYLYHDYIAMAGGIRAKQKDLFGFKDPMSFRFVEAMIWVWGNKPQYPLGDGKRSDNYTFLLWKQGKLNETWLDNLEYLAELIKMYRLGREGLFFGRMLRPPRLEGPGRTFVFLDGRTMALISVVAGAFGLPDGRVFIPLTNWGKRTESITSLVFERCSWFRGPYEFTLIRGNGLEKLGVFSGNAGVNIELRGGEAAVLVLVPLQSLNPIER